MDITIYSTRYLIENEDGDSYRDDGDTRTEVRTVDDTAEAIELIRNYGLSFKASGGGWASQPDGSYTSDYRTGEQTEVSAHLSDDISETDALTIMRGVDA